MISPAFSIAPGKLGIATRSSLANGSGRAKYASSRSTIRGVAARMYAVSEARVPAGAITRSGSLFLPTVPSSNVANGPTAIATRYDGSGSVGAKWTVRPSAPWSAMSAIGALPTAVRPAGMSSVTSQGTLNRGSSRHGTSLRACTASSWL